MIMTGHSRPSSLEVTVNGFVMPPFGPKHITVVHRPISASPWAQLSVSHLQGYTSSKAGMLGLTRAQAVSLDKKVRVNTVMPGYIDTPGSAGEITQDQHDWHLVGEPARPPPPPGCHAFCISQKHTPC